MDATLLKRIENLKSFETKNAESLKSVIEVTESSILNMYLSGIMLDSTKHAGILQTILDIEAGQVLWDIDKQRMAKELRDHIEIEKKMLEGLQEIMRRNPDKKIEPLIKQIITDERKHHHILTQLLGTIDNMDVLKEEWVDLYVKFQQEDFGTT